MRKILFVCLGNICRSPAAEGVMRKKLIAAGLGGTITVASAGTGDWHLGELPDPRMREHAKRRGYDLVSRAQQFTRRNFSEYDLIVVMDDSNYTNVLGLAESAADQARVVRFADFLQGETHVPDPYYGGKEGFEKVLDLLETGCDAIITSRLRS